MSEEKFPTIGHKMRAAVMAIAEIGDEGYRCKALAEYEASPETFKFSRSPYPCRCSTCECYTLAEAAVNAFHGPVKGKRK